MESDNEVYSDEIPESPDTDVSNAIPLTPSQEDVNYVSEFYEEFIKHKKNAEKIRVEKRDLIQKKSVLYNELMDFMVKSDVTCCPILIDQIPFYLRRSNKISTKQINPRTVSESLTLLNEEVIEEVVSARKRPTPPEVKKKPPKKKSKKEVEVKEETQVATPTDPTLLEALVDSIIKVTKDSCAVHRQDISVTTTRERGRKVLKDEDPFVLPEEIKKRAHDFHTLQSTLSQKNKVCRTVNQELRAMTRKIPQEIKSTSSADVIYKNMDGEKGEEEEDVCEMEDEIEGDETPSSKDVDYEDLKEKVSEYLQRASETSASIAKDGIRLQMKDGQEIPDTYVLKEKKVVTLKQFPMKQYPIVVADAVKKVLTHLQIPLDSKYDKNVIKSILNGSTVNTLAQNISLAVQEYQIATSKPQSVISLRKISNLKQKNFSMDKKEFDANRLITSTKTEGPLPLQMTSDDDDA